MRKILAHEEKKQLDNVRYLMNFIRMTAPEIKTLMAELKRWSSEKHGRQTELAREIGVSPKLVSDWIALRRPPSLNQYLKLQDFLKRQK
jgi:hypothetical protein